jgi:hypothetical protein
VLPPVAEAVEALRKAFPDSVIDVKDDGSGGAYVIVDSVTLGPKFAPEASWLGGHIPPQFPYADIYPVFMGADVRFASGAPFVAPITANHMFCGRPALQISRRTNRLEPMLQTAVCKFQKVLYWLIHQA